MKLLEKSIGRWKKLRVNNMTAKQFYIFTTVLIFLTIGTVYFTFFEPMIARSECADWSLTRTKALIPESFIEGSDDTLPVGPSEDSIRKVQATYDLHYSVCMDKGGYKK